ncbi:MAG: hypothetical protein APU95_01595 [Hadesarchaea archaeon YNP_N21]|jgi:quercetin dioxygenase-like cupin family protein|nr:MAG: hypothetical protein APU95_01595 [Hadesarchaea archaeon YNP_N21]
MVKIVSKSVEETPAAGGNKLRLLAHPAKTGNIYCQASLLRILPKHEFPSHFHPDSEDVIYILKGKATFTVGEEEFDVEQGDVIVISEGIVHSAINYSDEDVEMLVFQAPLPRFEFIK